MPWTWAKKLSRISQGPDDDTVHVPSANVAEPPIADITQWTMEVRGDSHYSVFRRHALSTSYCLPLNIEYQYLVIFKSLKCFSDTFKLPRIPPTINVFHLRSAIFASFD